MLACYWLWAQRGWLGGDGGGGEMVVVVVVVSGVFPEECCELVENLAVTCRNKSHDSCPAVCSQSDKPFSITTRKSVSLLTDSVSLLTDSKLSRENGYCT